MNSEFKTDLHNLAHSALSEMAPGTRFVERVDGSMALDGPEPLWVQAAFPPFDPFPFAQEGPAIRQPRFIHVPPDVQVRYNNEVAGYSQDTGRLNAEHQLRERQLVSEVTRLTPIIEDVRPILTLWYIAEVWLSRRRYTEDRAYPERLWQALSTGISFEEAESEACLDAEVSNLGDFQYRAIKNTFENRDQMLVGAVDRVAHYCAIENALNANSYESGSIIRDEDRERYEILKGLWRDRRFVELVFEWKATRTWKEVLSFLHGEYLRLESMGLCIPKAFRAGCDVSDESVDIEQAANTFSAQYRRVSGHFRTQNLG